MRAWAKRLNRSLQQLGALLRSPSKKDPNILASRLGALDFYIEVVIWDPFSSATRLLGTAYCEFCPELIRGHGRKGHGLGEHRSVG